MNNEAFSALGSSGEMDFCIVGYFQKILLAQFLAFSSIQKITKTINGHLLHMNGSNLSETSGNPLPKCLLDCMYPPSLKSHIY